MSYFHQDAKTPSQLTAFMNTVDGEFVELATCTNEHALVSMICLEMEAKRLTYLGGVVKCPRTMETICQVYWI